MIRLIATDLDGTLLDPCGHMPEGIFGAIEKLHRRGILFCAASGRQLAGLKALFRPVADKIVFLAENGALIAYGEETLYTDTLSEEKVLRALKAIERVPGAHPLLCTPGKAYYGDCSQPFLRYVQLSYISNGQRDLYDAANEPICKIAVYDERGPENNSMQILPPLLPDVRLTQSGGNWLDISEKSANKGNAMRILQEKFSLAADECAAFGDHMNDYEMLLACGHPYLPTNAYPRLKELFSGTAVIVPSNAENGVLRALNANADGKPVPQAKE